MASGTALSSFARCLDEKNAVALVRYVFRNDTQPKLGVLFPHFEENVDVLHFIQVSPLLDIGQIKLKTGYRSLTMKIYVCLGSTRLIGWSPLQARSLTEITRSCQPKRWRNSWTSL